VRVVFDTNVVVAGLVAEGLCREIVETLLPEHTPFLSDPLWHELVDTLAEKFDLTTADLPLLLLYRRLATWVVPAPLDPPVCRDPDDDVVLATAVVGRAEAIVTGDDDLLVLRSHAGIPILTPRQFLERLRSGHHLVPR
jgi:putative PIN family toxin of toxin-antitoxin system